jgi:transmembrane sensor
MADRMAFAQWLDEDASHRWAFEELSEVWARLRILGDVAPLLREPKVALLPSARIADKPPPPAPTALVHGDWSTLVVAVLLCFGCIGHFLLSAPQQEFVTGVGESRDIELSDGSLLELNARTNMRVSIDAQQRRVELQDGEAIFHVAHEARPFVVETEFGTVRALGTSFGVEISGDTLEVAVIEGQVSVTTAGDQVPLTEYDASTGHQYGSAAALLSKGEWLQVTESQQEQQALGTEEFRKRLAWRNGVVVFEDRPLQSVVEEMRRYTRVSVHVADSALNTVRVSGEYHTDDIGQFLRQLAENYEIIVDDRYTDWILLRAAPRPEQK